METRLLGARVERYWLPVFAVACLSVIACGDDDTNTDDVKSERDSGPDDSAGSESSSGSSGSGGGKASGSSSGTAGSTSGSAGSGGANSDPSSGSGGAGGSATGEDNDAGMPLTGSDGTDTPDKPDNPPVTQPEPAKNGPVVTGIWVRGADLNHTYLLASDAAPSGKVDLKNARELPDGTLTSFENAVYFLNWDIGGIDRYEVDAKLNLQKTGTLSFASYGISYPFSWHVLFFSATRAYYIDPDEARIIVWNPRDMTIDDEIDAPALARTGFSLNLGNANRVDDAFIVSALWSNEDDTDIDRKATALIFKDDATAPVLLMEDTRCPGTRSSFVDDRGDVYLLGDAYGGYLANGLGLDLPKPCMLRIKHGEQNFDNGYQFDIAGAAKASAMQGLWHLTERKFAVQSWPDTLDPATVIETSEDYWSADVLQWKLVDLDGNQVKDISGIGDSAPYQLIEFELDGTSYLLKHEDTDTDAGRSFLYALDVNASAKMVAEVSGDFWFLGRLTATMK